MTIKWLAEWVRCALHVLCTAVCIFLIAASVRGQQTLKVMTFNIWHGGRETGEIEGPLRVADVIRASGADIVAVQETYGSDERIAKALGFYRYLRGENLSIMSRYPIVEVLDAGHPFHGVAARIDVPGGPVTVASVWLNYPFDYWEDLEKSVWIESAQWRVRQDEVNAGTLRSILDTLRPLLARRDHEPVIVCGDFNTGSHLDWIDATRHLHAGYVMPFPTTQLMESEGFADAFQEIHPDPLRVPGNTWSPAFPTAFPDRIVYIVYRGRSLRAVDAVTIDLHPDQYPSDHAAVMTTFLIGDQPK